MLLKNQVCSVEQSKRLVELGVENGSAFAHVLGLAGTLIGTFFEGHNSSLAGERKLTFLPAFTVAELGVMLHMDAAGNLPPGLDPLVEQEDYLPAFSEAEYRAKMLIDVVEKRYVTAEEINQRLQNS